MVYCHLNTCEQRIDSDYFRSTQDPVTKCYSHSQPRWKAVHLPQHYWNTAYVDEQFAREMVETYYRTSTFVFGDGHGLIAKFLATDQLGLGFAPKELVASIEVRLSAITHACGSFRAYIFGVPKPPERLQGALEGVMELKKGSSVCIRFCTEAKSADERRSLFLGALPVLFHKMQVAALKRYRVRFVLDGEYEFRLDEGVLDGLEQRLWEVRLSLEGLEDVIADGCRCLITTILTGRRSVRRLTRALLTRIQTDRFFFKLPGTEDISWSYTATHATTVKIVHTMNNDFGS